MKIILVLTFCLIFQSSVWATTHILFLGDSLSEGLGVDEGQSFPRLVETILRNKKYDVTIVNGGVSGATSASGEGRLKWHMKKKMDILVLELGANDGLRGLKIAETDKNLRKVIKLARTHKIKVLLLGLLMPPNYGKKYSSDFALMYKTISQTENVPLLPFILNGIAGRPEYNQADGIHPNAKGHELIAKTVADFLEKNL